MAFSPSRTRIAAIAATIEANYGVAPTVTMATDGLLTILSPNPVQLDQRRFEFRPHGNTFTREKDILGARLYPVNLQFLMSGSGTAGNAGIAGFAAKAAILRSCGLAMATVGGTSITFTPDTLTHIAAAANMSCTIWANLDGWIKKVNGFIGNCVFSGNAESSITARVTGLGKYVQPVATSTAFSGWTGGTNNARPNQSIALALDPVGAVGSYTPVAFSYELDLGVSVDRVPDMNNAAGIWGIILADRDPRLRLSIGMDQNDSGVSYAELYADLEASTAHLVSWAVGSVAGNIVTFSVPTGQIINITDNETGNVRGVNIEYKVQHATPESELSIAIT